MDRHEPVTARREQSRQAIKNQQNNRLIFMQYARLTKRKMSAIMKAQNETKKGTNIMKLKTTAKKIREIAVNPRSAGYCDLQFLLCNHSPFAYTSGVYGWNFDIYEVYGVTISTGYRGMIGPRCEGIAEYEEKACEILSWENKEMTYDKKRIAVENLLHEFCKLNGGY